MVVACSCTTLLLTTLGYSRRRAAGEEVRKKSGEPASSSLRPYMKWCKECWMASSAFMLVHRFGYSLSGARCHHQAR